MKRNIPAPEAHAKGFLSQAAFRAREVLVAQSRRISHGWDSAALFIIKLGLFFFFTPPCFPHPALPSLWREARWLRRLSQLSWLWSDSRVRDCCQLGEIYQTGAGDDHNNRIAASCGDATHFLKFFIQNGRKNAERDWFGPSCTPHLHLGVNPALAGLKFILVYQCGSLWSSPGCFSFHPAGNSCGSSFFMAKTFLFPSVSALAG